MYPRIDTYMLGRLCIFMANRDNDEDLRWIANSCRRYSFEKRNICIHEKKV